MENQEQIQNSSPAQRFELKVDDFIFEAQNWLDGDPIENDGQAEQVTKLMTGLRALAKQADDKRLEINKPHKEITDNNNAAFKPVAKKSKTTLDALKLVLGDWLDKVEKAKQERAEQLRKEAEAEAAKLREMERKADGRNLADQIAIQETQEHVDKLQGIAKHIEKKPAQVKVDGARAVSIRVSYEAKIIDRRALLNHVVKTDPDYIKRCLQDWANTEVTRLKKDFEGVECKEIKKAA